MNNAKKFLKVSTAIGAFFLCGGILSTTLNKPLNNVSAAETSTERVYTESDFAGETLEGSDFIVANISQATTTESSAAFTVTFRSKTLVGFKNVRNNFVVRIDDAAYTGDEDNPVDAGHERYTEDGLPIVDGTLVYILGNESGNLYVPNHFVRTSKFAIELTSIASGVITQSGDSAFESAKNNWDKTKVKDIYLPETIENAESGAFTDVPADVTFHFQGSEVPAGFASDWATTITPEQIKFNAEYNKRHIEQVATSLVDLPDPLNRPIDYILGYEPNDHFPGEEYNKPLVVEYDIVTFDGEKEVSRETKFEALPIQHDKNPYDSVGTTFKSHTIELLIDLNDNEKVDDHSLVFHNVYRSIRPIEGKGLSIDLEKPLKVNATVGYDHVQPLSNLVSYKPTHVTKFLGYSVFGLEMDLNYNITSEAYPEPHSLYLDVKTDMYVQNLSKIMSGETRIRYSLYNLYKTTYCFEYIGENGQLKYVETQITSPITYQELNSLKGNVVSLLVKDSDIAPDFKSENVTKFSIKDLNIQMDLLTISASGSTAKLAKSEILYRFGNIIVFEKEANNVPAAFDYNIFVIIFYAVYLVIYLGVALLIYKVTKEKFKNDEFRRVNTKKFIKTAAIGCGGLALILAALLSIIMRTTGFNNSIVVFNPTDPFVIILSIFAAIALGYFIVNLIKSIKTELQRRQTVRLKLNEDKDDDGTN